MVSLVFGAGGFIGGHLVRRLLQEGKHVVGVDIKEHEYFDLRSLGCEFILCDLRDTNALHDIVRAFKPDELYQLAADMGGAGFVFTGENDADIMHNSAQINLNTCDAVAAESPSTRIFYSSSACIYPGFNQTDPDNPNCEESSAYPAEPDSEYGWEKLFSERLYRSYARNKGLQVRIARYHNIFGPQGTWRGGREKAPAALCRKVAEATRENPRIEIWGSGRQTRSFLYVDECVEGTLRLMRSSVTDVVNIGSEEMVSIDELAVAVADIAGKRIELDHVQGPVGVAGRCSDNRLIETVLGWKPTSRLKDGLEKTYRWIEEQVKS